jgi:hypothetical protein
MVRGDELRTQRGETLQVETGSLYPARHRQERQFGVEADGEQPACTLLPNFGPRQEAIGGRDMPIEPDSTGDERDSQTSRIRLKGK